MIQRASSPVLQLIRRVGENHFLKALADQELLHRFSAMRDDKAYNAILRRHGAMVLEVCRSVLGNEQDAEDAFQATFLILARKGGSIRKSSSLASWLYGVAYRTALKAQADFARRRKHELRSEASARKPDDASPDEFRWREV